MANISSLDASKYYKADNKPNVELEAKEYAKDVVQMIFNSDYADKTDVYLLQKDSYRVKSNDGVDIKDEFGLAGFDKLDNESIISWDKTVKKEISKLSGTSILVQDEISGKYVETLPLFTINEDASTFMDLDLHKGEFEVVLTLKEQKSENELYKEQVDANLAQQSSDLTQLKLDLANFEKKITKAVADLRTKTLSQEDLDELYTEVDESTPPEIKNYLDRAIKKAKAHKKDKEVLGGTGQTGSDELEARKSEMLRANKITSGTVNSKGLNIKTKGKTVKDDDTKSGK